jgi:hypothetical protein
MLRISVMYSRLFQASVLCGFLLSGFTIGVQTAKAGKHPIDNNPNASPVLVELFTSEGCSSCPPADEFVQKLDVLQPVPGAQIIVLSEHVDYWDHDGWKDPNSSHALTERQSAYVHMLGLSTPYTPQIIVDGSKELKITDAQAVEMAFQQAASASKSPVRISGVAFDKDNPNVLRAQVEADGGEHNADLYLAVALDHVDSQVLRGENGGRHLTHVAVVQQMAKIGKLSKGKNFSESVQLKLKNAATLDQIRVVAFAQESGPGKLLGATVWKAAR